MRIYLSNNCARGMSEGTRRKQKKTGARGTRPGERSAAAAHRKPNSVRLHAGFRRRFGVTIIPLAPPSLAGSSSLPGGFRLRVPLRRNSPEPWRRRLDGPSSSASLFGLAPCGVLPATRVATGAVRSYRTFSPLLAPGRLERLHRDVSGVFSVPLSFRSP